MSQRMLIDARHPEETRVAVVNGQRIEEFDFEAADRKQLKGNIYLAKVTRVEPSLQAAFVEYGGNRHGFLAFSEIHPDYYQIPLEDREALLREEQELHAEENPEDHDEELAEGEEREEIAEAGGHDDTSDSMRRQRQALRRRYKIQEVIRRRQVLLIQVVKEERGNKGAALTTYLSLAGRYCVLMPNTAHGGGISRKISNISDRKRLKSIMADLKLPTGMGAIVRTAGLKRSKSDIKRDFDYLTRLWDEIRETTLAATAPALVHEDSGLIKRAIRDIYNREIDQVLVDGPEGFEAASTFMKLLMPTHAPKVVQYEDSVPLFQRFGVEAQLSAMYSPVVQLKSGGYIVINPTEALVSIDINSGRSTREHGIEETAFKTNMEAAEEIGRQLRLRDMAGLVVIDFIDMEVNGNNRRVERAMKDALRNDRARIQLGRISSFGLMEMSRQRLRTGILEASTHVCPMCDGSGYVRAISSAALAALRDLEAEAIKGRCNEFTLRAGAEVAIYILNRKRAELAELEDRYGIGIEAVPDDSLTGPNYIIDAAGGTPLRQIVLAPLPAPVTIAEDIDEVESYGGNDEDDDEDGEETERREPREPREARGEDRGGKARGRGRRRRGGRSDAPVEGEAEAVADGEAPADEVIDGDVPEAPPITDAADTEAKRRRRRGRRGGRRRDGETGAEGENAGAEDAAETGDEPVEAAAEPVEAPVDAPVEAPVADETPAKRPRRARAKKADADAVAEPVVEAPAEPAVEAVAEEAPAKAPRKRAPRRKAGAEVPVEAEAPAAEPELAAAPPAPEPEAAAPANDAEVPANDATQAPEAPARKGWWQRTFVDKG